MRYRKKPVEVEAVRVRDVLQYRNQQPGWVLDAFAHFRLFQAGNELVVTTLEGTMRAHDGFWLVQGVRSELYFCRDDIFQATYEKTEK